jgi:hypothetical protein
MNSLQSLVSTLAAAGTIYGWRVDAILLGGMLWTLMTLSAPIRSAPRPARLRFVLART